MVIKDAKQIDGPLTAWQKDDKVWLELAPEDFGKPFFLSPKLNTGIGEAFVLGGLMAYPVNGAGGQQVVEFRRVHNQVRLLARNVDVHAPRPARPRRAPRRCRTRPACWAARRWPASRTRSARPC